MTSGTQLSGAPVERVSRGSIHHSHRQPRGGWYICLDFDHHRRRRGAWRRARSVLAIATPAQRSQSLIEHTLADCIHGHDAMDPPAAWRAMTKSVRNMGRDGLAATGISAVDVALWDLKAKLLDLPLALLLGRARDAVPIYGSGGFTTYSDDQLRGQLADWVERDGCRWVKMKVGSDPDRDPHRTAVAKHAIGERSLFVDANGAYSVRQALSIGGNLCAESRTCGGSRNRSPRTISRACTTCGNICRRAWSWPPGNMVMTWTTFVEMLEAGVVDVQQADATRCGGITGFMMAAASLRGSPRGPIRPLCTCAAFARRLRGAAFSSSGMVSRSRSDRTHAIRWRSVSCRRGDTPRPLATGTRPRVQATGRSWL